MIYKLMGTKKILITIILVWMGVNAINAQDPNYIMTIELNNGTKMKLNTNDVTEITFLDGKLVVTGGSLADRIDSLAKVVSDNYYDLYYFIKEKDAYYEVEVDSLKKKITALENKIDSLTHNQSGTLSTEIVGTWRVTQSDYRDLPVNAIITFNSDGSTSLSDMRYTVDGDTLEMDYLYADGSVKEGYKGAYIISGKEATYTFIIYEKGKWWEDAIHTLKATKQD